MKFSQKVKITTIQNLKFIIHNCFCDSIYSMNPHRITFILLFLFLASLPSNLWAKKHHTPTATPTETFTDTPTATATFTPTAAQRLRGRSRTGRRQCGRVPSRRSPPCRAEVWAIVSATAPYLSSARAAPSPAPPTSPAAAQRSPRSGIRKKKSATSVDAAAAAAPC